jgi:hypothetical protein
MQATKKGTTFTIYAIPIIESVNELMALPTRYKEYKIYLRRRMQIYFLNTVRMIVQLIFRKVLNHSSDQSISYLKRSLLPSENTLMKILSRILFDISSP